MLLTCVNAVGRPSGRSAAFAVVSRSLVTFLVHFWLPRGGRIRRWLARTPWLKYGRNRAMRFRAVSGIHHVARPEAVRSPDAKAPRSSVAVIAPGALADLGVQRPSGRRHRDGLAPGRGRRRAHLRAGLGRTGLVLGRELPGPVRYRHRRRAHSAGEDSGQSEDDIQGRAGRHRPRLDLRARRSGQGLVLGRQPRGAAGRRQPDGPRDACAGRR